MKKERAHPHDQGALHTLRAEYAEQHGGRSTGSQPSEGLAPYKETSSRAGWPIWLAWSAGLLAFFMAAIAGIFLGVAVLTPIALSATWLEVVLLAPVVGGALALVGTICALLATRRARRAGADVAAPIMLACLSTVVLIAGLFFGGLVAYPRVQLATFGQAIQAHCARLAQTLQPYQNLSATQLAIHAPDLLAAIQNDSASLPDDQAALDTLTAPGPTYQPLLDDCKQVAQDDRQTYSALQQDLQGLNPLQPDQDQKAVQAALNTISTYKTETSKPLAQIQQLGAQLQREIFAPFQPG